MNTEKSVSSVKICLTESEKVKAKEIAKAQGYTFQGWLGKLVRNEIVDCISVTSPHISNINHSSDSFSFTTIFKKD